MLLQAVTTRTLSVTPRRELLYTKGCSAMPMRPDIFAEHAMLLSEPRAPQALARTSATLGIWNSGWPFTVAVLERPSNQPLRPPPIALLTVTDGQEGWPLTPQQVILHVAGGSRREVCRPRAQRLPPPGSWFNFSVTFKGNSALLEVAGCSVLGSLGGSRAPLSLAVWGAVDPARVVLGGTTGLALAPLPRSMYAPPAADAPSCEVLHDAAERLHIFTSADDAFIRSGGLDMMARGFLREAAAKLVVIGSADATAAVRTCITHAHTCKRIGMCTPVHANRHTHTRHAGDGGRAAHARQDVQDSSQAHLALPAP